MTVGTLLCLLVVQCTNYVVGDLIPSNNNQTVMVQDGQMFCVRYVPCAQPTAPLPPEEHRNGQ